MIILSAVLLQFVLFWEGTMWQDPSTTEQLHSNAQEHAWTLTDTFIDSHNISLFMLESKHALLPHTHIILSLNIQLFIICMYQGAHNTVNIYRCACTQACSLPLFICFSLPPTKGQWCVKWKCAACDSINEWVAFGIVFVCVRACMLAQVSSKVELILRLIPTCRLCEKWRAEERGRQQIPLIQQLATVWYIIQLKMGLA